MFAKLESYYKKNYFFLSNNKVFTLLLWNIEVKCDFGQIGPVFIQNFMLLKLVMSVTNCFWLATCKADSRWHNLHLSHKCTFAIKTFMIHPYPRWKTNLGTIVNQINFKSYQSCRYLVLGFRLTNSENE